METRRVAAAWLLLALGMLGCSKTQDTAPERRIFGDPPAIGSVTLDAATQTAVCDATTTFKSFFCVAGTVAADSYMFSPGPITVSIGYTEFKFHVQVTDPQSTTSQSDILLVTASFQTPVGEGSPEETSLLLLDDGGALVFPWQQSLEPLDICTFDSSSSPPCICSPGRYNLTTNDTVEADNIFTRGFAFLAPAEGIPPNGFSIVESCVVKARAEAPYSAGAYIGKTVEFMIEAIDRAGNDTVWPVRPAGQVNPTTYTCTGDDCACCYVGSSDPSACRGKSGMIALSDSAGWPTGTGLCQNL